MSTSCDTFSQAVGQGEGGRGRVRKVHSPRPSPFVLCTISDQKLEAG